MAKVYGGVEIDKHIHKGHTQVTTSQNTTGSTGFEKILEVEASENEVLIFPKGVPIQLKLYDSGSTEIDEGDEIKLKKIGVAGKEEIKIGDQIYAPWANVAYADQADPDYAPQMDVPFDDETAPGFKFVKGEKFQIHIKSSQKVDWTQSSTQILLGFGQKVKP